MTLPFALKPKKIIIFLMVLLAIITAVYLVGNYLTNPKWVVDDYLKALKARDYKKAYGYFIPDQSPTLNREAFVAWQRNNDQTLGSIKFSALGKAQVGANSARVNYLLQREKEVDKKETNLTLIRSGKTLFFWPKWKIEIPTQNQEFSFRFEGAKLYLDSRETGLATKRTQPFDFKVFSGEHKIEFKARNAEVLLVDLQHANPMMKPTEAVINDITGKAWELAERVKKAYNANDDALLSTLLGTGSDNISRERKYYASITEFQEPYVTVTDFYSPDKVEVDIWLAYDGVKTDPYYDFWGGLTMRSLVFINRNGNWELDSIENKMTPQPKGPNEKKKI